MSSDIQEGEIENISDGLIITEGISVFSKDSTKEKIVWMFLPQSVTEGA